MIGTRVGNYQITDEIGAGGMGTVFRGVDAATNQSVAVKHLKPELLSSDMLQRFAREGEALRTLNHPNIVKVLAAVENEGQHYLVMEYVPGGSLSDLLAAQSPLPITRALQIALELADALTRAHHLKIIHRDIKPANILLAEDGTPRLTDFGVAHFGGEKPLTQTGVAIGTLDYLSPEALNGDSIDTRADIWAFGVLLFEMLAGKRPFDHPSMTGIITAILTQSPPDLEALRPDAPIALVDLVYRMLEKDPNQRIPSVRQVGAELENILQGRDTTPTGSRVGAPLSPSAFDTPTPATDPLSESDKPPHNLPIQTTPFIGREQELAELTKLFNTPATRLVTILAPGGMGKTRLALEIAQTLLNRGTVGALHATPSSTSPYVNGIFFIALAPLTSPDFIISTIADSVRFQFQPDGREPKQQLLDSFREKSLLLVLDNFEHLLDGANIVSDILNAAPGVKILATSRERLNLSGEILYPLSGMDFPDWETPEDALNYAAVKLFMQSARRIRPDFELHGDELTYLARICRLVAGMPLGIVLAAAWVEALSLKDIAKEIERSLDFLETELRDVPERQRSIRGVFEYSWNRLSNDERSVFKKLSVFRGGFTREAAQTVAGASLKTLTTLVNKSLLRRDPKGRYEVHELLRQYGEQQLTSSGELDPARNAHATYFADFLHQREPDLKGHRQLAALDEIEVDYENVRTMWRWATDQKNLDLLDRVLESLYWFCDMRGRFQELAELFRPTRDALAPLPGNEPSRVWRRLSAYLVRFIMLGSIDFHEDLHTIITTSLALTRVHNDPPELAFCLLTMGIYAQQRGQDTTAALPFLDESLQLYRQLDDHYYIADLLTWFGNSYQFTQPQRALGYFQQALELKRAIGDKSGLAWGLWNLGLISFTTAGLSEAERYVQESLALMREKRDDKGAAFCIAVHCWMAFWAGEFEKSRSLAREAWKFAVIVDVLFLRAGGTLMDGLLTCILDSDFASSIPFFQESITLSKKINALDLVFQANLGLALAAYGQADYQIAHGCYRTALKDGQAIAAYSYILWFSIAALLYAQAGQKAFATELLSLAYNHPHMSESWRTSWSLLPHLRAQLQADLGADVYAVAWERGEARNLDATERELLERADQLP